MSQTSKPVLRRTTTVAMRSYLERLLSRISCDYDISALVKELKFRQRVSPLVNLGAYGKPNLAERLRSEGVLSEEVNLAIHKLIKESKGARKARSEFEKLKILFISATEFRGVAAEIRPSYCMFMQEFGVKADWAIIDGCEDFYKATYHVSQGIQSSQCDPLTKNEHLVLSVVSINNVARFESLGLFNYDLIWIDGHEPLGMVPMIRALHPELPVVWQCHKNWAPEASVKSYIKGVLEGEFDRNSNKVVWNYMNEMHRIDLTTKGRNKLRVHGTIFRIKEFASELELSPEISSFIMESTVDPFSLKNMALSKEFILETLKKYCIYETEERELIVEGTATRPLIRQGSWGENPPLYVAQICNYETHKGPFEVVVAFIEAMVALAESENSEEGDFLSQNCCFALVGLEPEKNRKESEILAHLQLFVRNCPIFEKKKVPDLRHRILLLTLKSQRRTEVLNKMLFDKLWEISTPEIQEMARSVLMQNESEPLETLIEKLLEGKSPLISEETATYLRRNEGKIGGIKQNSYFTPEQTEEAADCVRNSNFLDPTLWTKIKSNLLSGNNINDLEVNALQSGAAVRCQFSSTKGNGIGVAEAMVKADNCTPKVSGITVASDVEGICFQVHPRVGIPISYSPQDVTESIKMYREMTPDDVDTAEKCEALYEKIAGRNSVSDFSAGIVKAVTMQGEERIRMCEKARAKIFKSFCLHIGVEKVLSCVTRVMSNVHS